jgi:GTP:adenosylcobinamide-phosphate guanylyltransferase
VATAGPKLKTIAVARRGAMDMRAVERNGDIEKSVAAMEETVATVTAETDMKNVNREASNQLNGRTAKNRMKGTEANTAIAKKENPRGEETVLVGVNVVAPKAPRKINP